ncbi:hypothetical protein GS473_04470 [Rhodococcus hoagii]|nr:hypothetical protein [Prescottella equi]
MAHRIRLRRSELDKHMAAAGLTHQNDLAAAMRMSEPAISRAMLYNRTGNRFIASLLAAFPHLRFEDLFEVVPEERTFTVEEAADAVGVTADWYVKRLIDRRLSGHMIRHRWMLTDQDISAAIRYCDEEKVASSPMMLNLVELAEDR